MSSTSTAVGVTTTELADAILELAERDLPEGARVAAERTLFNIIAVANGAARTEGVQRLARSVASLVGVPVSPSPLTPAIAAEVDAALITGFAAHYDDYDDTHLATVIHPAAACLGAAWAVGRGSAVDGRTLLSAFALGCEVQLRLGNVVSPEHYDRGWHITGTCGVLGATVTAALLAGLGRDELAAALTLATVQTLGHREAFGTELKPFHAGQAAANAVTAATDAPDAVSWLSDVDALPHLLSALAPDTADPGRLLASWGSTWELESNAMKPYPCGIVAHPGIDAGIAVHAMLADRGIPVSSILEVRYRCHPLVPELMGRLSPGTGLEARFSAVHGVAAGLIHGTVGLHEFSASSALDPEVVQLRSMIVMESDVTLDRDQAELVVTIDGRETLVERVEHARGSLARPMTDAELVLKAEALLAAGHGPAASELWSFVTNLYVTGEDPWSRLPTQRSPHE